MAESFSEQEKAYFAGYTDAEGCIYLRTQNERWYLTVSFKQTQPVAIEKLCAHYGGSMSIVPGSKRPLKQWRLQAHQDARRFIADVLPYLREKREQAEIALHEFHQLTSYRAGLALSDRLSRLKERELEPIVIKSRLAIAERNVYRKCLECGEPALARGLCGKHYRRAVRDGRIKTNSRGTGVPFEYLKPLQPNEAPYFAGYFDGDGSLVLHTKGPHWYGRVTFGQTQPDAVIAMQAVYGGSLKFVQTKYRPKPYLQYQLCQREALLAFLADIKPFVLEKREQVETFLEGFTSTLSLEEGEALKARISAMKERAIQAG